MKHSKRIGKVGRCVHCLRPLQGRTKDHVFPRAWYPKSTPPDMQRWTIPSCSTCNKQHGCNEEYLLVRMGLCFDPDDSEFSDIANKAQRAIDPGAAKNAKDARKRAHLRQSIRSELFTAGPEVDSHALAGFDATWAHPNGSYTAVPIDAHALQTLATKMAKGLAYIYDHNYIGDTHDFIVRHVRGPESDIESMLRKHGASANRGPGIYSLWASVPKDPATRVHYFSVWKRWNMYVFAIPKDIDEQLRAERADQLQAQLDEGRTLTPR